ncbi:hypothetical protein [Flavobacterium micromati]|nr:hypothetical protein [Flavobacterium micromati]
MITRIEIRNVKGIGTTTENCNYNFEISPNKPNILVAPNGFGKSSFSVAFKSLQPGKIVLEKEHYFKNSELNLPSISITYEENGTSNTVSANQVSNIIKSEFDYFVINNQIYAKAKKNNLGGFVIATASLETPPIILVNNIPELIHFDYTITHHREVFGQNGKVLKNISVLFGNDKMIKGLANYYVHINRLNTGVKTQEKLNSFIERVNEQVGNAETVLDWIENNELGNLEDIPYLRDIKNYIISLDLNYTRVADSFLTAIQFAKMFKENEANFKAAILRKIYNYEKDQYEALFASFNSSWQNFKPLAKDNKLIVEIPKTAYISNGQRDVMCFIALLKKAELKLTKSKGVLIIDEVFDYLDDANLIAVQYYVTQFIQKFQSEGRKIYPIIFTHLNPYFFKNFVFSKQKVHFLNSKAAKINEHFKKILINRENILIKDNVSKYHLHYEPISINIRPDFESLNLKPTWGNSQIFEEFIGDEFTKYNNNEEIYDPFAVCCAVRKKVEKNIYDKLLTQEFKDEFLNTHTTPNKLKFAENKGVVVPEIYYLLGIIYNDGMHWKDNEVSIANKLENYTIRKMIGEI